MNNKSKYKGSGIAFFSPVVKHCAFAVALVLLLSAFPLSAQWNSYRSNAIGMALKKIEVEKEEKGEKGPRFLLKRRVVHGELREEILLEKGKEVYTKKYTREAGKLIEEEFRDGVKVRKTVHRDGKPIYVWKKNEEGTPSETYYEWDGARPVAKRTSEGEKSEHTFYLLDAKGRPGQVRRKDRLSAYVSDNEGELLGEWHVAGERTEFIRHGPGKHYQSSILEGEEKILSRTTSREDGRIRVEKRYSKGSSLVEWYDKSDRLVERLTRGEGVFKRETFTYRSGKLVLKQIRSPEMRKKYRYTYDADGKRKRVEIRKNGEIFKEIEYRDKNERVETLYRDREPLYTNIFRDQELIRREYDE